MTKRFYETWERSTKPGVNGIYWNTVPGFSVGNHLIDVSENEAEKIKDALQEAYNQGQRDLARELLNAVKSIAEQAV